ncbi:hypothetical protein BDK51DRAFT_30425, partial [Blyttiomyces helicus]
MKTATLLSTCMVAGAIAAPHIKRSTDPVTIPISRHASDKSPAARAINSLKPTQARLSTHRRTLAKRSQKAELVNTNDLFYYATVTVGNGPDCTDKDGSCPPSDQRVDTTDSQLTDAGAQFDDVYGTGEARGEIYQGPYTLAGATASNAVFGVINFEAVAGSQSPVQTLGLSSFGFYLSHASDGDNGELTVNGFDSRKISGPLNY